MQRDQDEAEPEVGGENQQNKQLINEAIKRILLDIVIRGHGDRLIGRWSREPQIQAFLERVPYLLDRVNQLHLACTRPDQTADAGTSSHHHHHHHHRHHHHHHHQHHLQIDTQNSSLHEFVNLIGVEQLDSNAWLVRTRDSLGLTPIHKAVLFHNRPVCEFILDRYPDELAAPSSSRANQSGPNQTAARLIDAQDKYGRTALHYAAASANDSLDKQTGDLYRLLTLKGASTKVCDFRGKTPAYYKDHPNQLRAKSIIHLANKLNANYQANVLSRTLRAMAFRESSDLLGSDDERDGREDPPQSWHSAGANQRRPAQPGDNRESMSMSCADLSNAHSGQLARRSSQSLINLNQDEQLYGHLDDIIETDCDRPDSKPQLEATTFESASLRSSLDIDSTDTNDAVQSMKSLIKERSSRLILSEKTRLRIRRQLVEGKVDQINELLIEGFGQQLLTEAPVTCWNQQCRQYVLKVVPDLLRQLDTLHEFIAANQFESMRRLLEQSHPILVRMRRPYKRAAMNSLHLAVHRNRRSIVMFLLERYPELINQLDSNGATCLHWAARALHNDRLYAWLTEHFGAQLESLRDDRGKTAANYRQQTIRMHSVDDRELDHDTKPNKDTSSLIQSKQQRIERKNFSKIMHKQHENERQLEVKGASERLVRRPACKRRHATPPSRSQRAEADESQAEPDQIQVRIGVESPSTLDSTCSRDEPTEPKSESKLAESKMQAAESRPDVELEREPKSEWLSSGQEEEQVERSRLLADELVQLDVHEDDTEPDRAASLTGDDKKESDAKSSSNSIEQIIRKCIVTGDLMKLEHLILAGCGQRVTRVYEGLNSPRSDSTLVNDQTRDFIERRSIELMQTIERIHAILHQCYSHATTIGHRPNSACQTINLTQSSSDQPIHNANGRGSKNGAETNLEASSEPLAAVMNSKFHKMCSLLSSNWLVMARDKFGACPLHVALLRSDRRLLDYLLRRYPNAAGAPDHDSRNALHYAAIVLAAFERHGPMRLVKMTADSTSDEMRSDSMGVARPHWLVDATSRLLYDNLCARYSHELSEARDKFGKTHQDYLQSSTRTSEVHHTKLDDLPAGPLEAHVIENCCEQYAVMLLRYQYAIWVKSDPDRLELVASVDEKQEPGEDDGKPGGGDAREPSGQVEYQGRVVETYSSSLVEARQSAAPSDGGHLPDQADRTGSGALIGDESTNLSPLTAWDSPAAQEDHRHQHRSRTHRKGATSARHSIVGGVIVPTIIHNDKMDEIETYDIIYRQPQQSSRASSPSPSSCSSCSSASCSSASSLSSSSISLDELNRTDGHHRHHHKQMTVDDQHLSKHLTKTLNQRSPLSSSHKRHRRRGNHDHRQRHHHNLSRASSEKLPALLPGAPELVPAGPSGAPVDEAAKTFGKNVAARVDSPSSSSSDEDDERVERLSNEFENRVRREKNELRAKVDQIMREIKMSARSRKSSRFLSSPNDLMALNSMNLIGVDGIGALNNHKTGASDNKHKSSTASTSSKNTTISDSSRTSSSNASSSSRCSSSKTGSVPLGSSRKSRNSSNLSASTTASSLSVASSPVAAKPVTGNERANPQQPLAAQANQIMGEGQRLLPTNTNQHHLSELTDQLVSKNSYGQTYLHFIASRSQNSSTFYRVLEHSNHLIAERDVFYRTARDVALQFNLLNNVQLLDKFVIDLFVQGRMQLLWALLKQGYSPLIHVADADGNDIMLILKLLKRDSMICCLLQMADFQRWRDELHTYIRNNYISGAIELIRDHRELVKAKSAYSRTSLHLAVLFDRIEMVDELIAIDPTSVHVVDNMGRTPLHYAFGLNLKNGDSIREKLISSGSQADFRDVRQRTAKYYYIFKREIEEIRRVEMDIN